MVLVLSVLYCITRIANISSRYLYFTSKYYYNLYYAIIFNDKLIIKKNKTKKKNNAYLP